MNEEKIVKIYAHSSCIKGLTAKIDRKNEDCITVHSSGYDQRLKTWKVQGISNEQELKIEKVDSERHSLSDMNWMNRSGDTLILGG